MVCQAEGLERSERLVENAARLSAKAPPLRFTIKGKATTPAPESWPPAHLQLPSTIEGIEKGRPEPARQRDLLYGTRKAWIGRLAQ